MGIHIRKTLVGLTAWAKGAGLIDSAIRGNPLPRIRISRAVAAFAAADKAERRRLTEILTARALVAARRSPYGRAFPGPLEAWPILTKDVVRDRNADFRGPGRLYIPAATGGTTGVPVRLWRSPGSVSAEQMFMERLVAPDGVALSRCRVAILRGDMIKSVTDQEPPFGVVSHGGRQLVLSQPHLTPRTFPWYADALSRFRPDVLWTYPSLAGDLARFSREQGIPLRLPLVLACSEYMAPPLHREVAETFGAKVVEYYGQSERVCLAAGEGIERYCFEPAYGRVELLAEEDDPVEDGRRHVRIIGTGYWNPATALVRYDTGDRAMVPADADAETLEEIALGVQPFFGVAGRIDEYVLTPEGRKICALSALPREADNIVQMQILQTARDAVVLKVIPRPGFGQADADRLMANARAKIPLSVSVTIELVERLETTSRGKAILVIRRLPPAAC